MTLNKAKKQIQDALRQAQKGDGEITLDGNGINSSEAALTLRWVVKILKQIDDTDYRDEQRVYDRE